MLQACVASCAGASGRVTLKEKSGVVGNRGSLFHFPVAIQPEARLPLITINAYSPLSTDTSSGTSAPTDGTTDQGQWNRTLEGLLPSQSNLPWALRTYQKGNPRRLKREREYI